MRHGKGGFKLNRTKSHRKALFRNLLTSLFEYEKIKTTSTKAKAIKPLADKLVTLAKRGDLAARRQASRVLFGSQVLKKLFDELVPRFKSRNSGYTRIYKLGHRKGDAAEISLIELILDKVEAKAADKADKDVKDLSKPEEAAKKKVKKVSKGVKKSKGAKKVIDKKKKETKKKEEKKEVKKKATKAVAKTKVTTKKVTTAKTKKSSPTRKKG